MKGWVIPVYRATLQSYACTVTGAPHAHACSLAMLGTPFPPTSCSLLLHHSMYADEQQCERATASCCRFADVPPCIAISCRVLHAGRALWLKRSSVISQSFG